MALQKVVDEVFPLAGWEFEVFEIADGEFAFHGATVCDYFGIKNPTVSIQRHVDEEWRFKDGTNSAWYVTEPGLYQLAFVSKTALAKNFQRWVFKDLLPKLRSRRVYAMPTATSEDFAIVQREVERLRDQVHQMKTAKRQAELKAQNILNGLGFIQSFVDHCLECDPNRENTPGAFFEEIYGVYVHYCKTQKKESVAWRKFKTLLQQCLGVEYDNGVQWSGVSIKHAFKEVGYQASCLK